MNKTPNTNITVDLSGSLISFDVARTVYFSATGNYSPDLSDGKVRAEFFAFWAGLQLDMQSALKRERITRDEKRAARRKEHQELVGNLERRLTAMYKALTDYPKTDERHSQAKVVCDGVRKLAQQIINEGKPQ